ncbi:MAG TPA: lytic murein transglycosylase, partial [Solirubrobacterales bacterium]|nr:lytic murein transglycosylase [Solirubrobacterales bacterium]
ATPAGSGDGRGGAGGGDTNGGGAGTGAGGGPGGPSAGGIAPPSGGITPPENEGGGGSPLPGSVIPVAPPQLDLSPVPSVVCTDAPGAPRGLLPIYQAASDKYELGPQGPGILASINLIETRFGELNEVTSSAGAQGWMQFMPGTWDAYGVDADGDGVADPYNPRDAIFSAANYLSASGAPSDWYGAIFAYNRADWYVAEVLAKAGCYGSLHGGVFSLVPKLEQFSCEPAKPRLHRVPERYMVAFEEAAGRYELDRRGVWALAAIARLESDFGRGMSGRELLRRGPLGIDQATWEKFAVDGDGDGRIRRASPEDSAATLARAIWSAGDLRTGVFNHNQASWYVQAVLNEADRLAGGCEVKRIGWPLALPEVAAADAINWDNLELTRDSQRLDIEGGLLDPRVIQLLATITQNHRILITSVQTDHSMLTASGNVSNHYYGRAIDIAAVDGVSCTDTSESAPCATLGRALTLLPLDQRPTELIYCHDLDGPAGPAIAMADHCDHIHAGFHGY